jgi:PTH1 family peptidyl-tRNA hydrolase
VKILLGLGNPGPEYENNRHNVGMWCAEGLARRLRVRLRRVHHALSEGLGQLAGEPLVVARARTYMNRSGGAARRVLERHGAGIQDLMVAHDDVDLSLGVLRVKAGGGAGGHNGLRSIMEVLGGGDFTRIRLGVGRPASAGVDLADWVLEDFDRDEEDTARELAERGMDAVEVILAAGVTAAMNRFNVSTTQGGARTNR